MMAIVKENENVKRRPELYTLHKDIFSENILLKILNKGKYFIHILENKYFCINYKYFSLGDGTKVKAFLVILFTSINVYNKFHFSW